jgi:hypothetical protein
MPSKPTKRADAAAWAFINERASNFGKNADNAEYKQMIIDLMLSDIPLPPGSPIRHFLAGELGRYYFDGPTHKARARARHRQWLVNEYQGMIKQFAKEGNTSEAKAKQQLVDFCGLKSVEALNQFFKRERQKRYKNF